MNNVVIIGIIAAGIIVGIFAVLSLNQFSILKDDEVAEKGPILPIEEESKDEKPQGRNLSIEFDEKMGFTDP